MKRQFLICASIAALLLIIWLFWPRAESQKIVPAQANEAPASPAKEVMHEITNAETTAIPPHTNLIVVGGASQSRMDKWKQIIESKNMPFDFYGKVIDQDNNPLAGVSIHMHLRHWQVDSTAPIPVEKQTDGEGRFDIHGMTGDAFDLKSMEKSGYELEPGRRGYDAVGGTLTEPVVFKMWKTNIHEHLITGSKHIKIIPDGRPYAVDLINGTIVEAQNSEDDLQIWVKRPDIQSGQKYYEWSFGIKPENGGLLLEPDINSAMFVAPSDGYSNQFVWTQPATNSGWGAESGNRRFYVKMRGQDYGKITVSVDAFFIGSISGYNTGDGRLSVNYAVNPSGSTILR